MVLATDSTVNATQKKKKKKSTEITFLTQSNFFLLQLLTYDVVQSHHVDARSCFPARGLKSYVYYRSAAIYKQERGSEHAYILRYIQLLRTPREEKERFRNTFAFPLASGLAHKNGLFLKRAMPTARHRDCRGNPGVRRPGLSLHHSLSFEPHRRRLGHPKPRPPRGKRGCPLRSPAESPAPHHPRLLTPAPAPGRDEARPPPPATGPPQPRDPSRPGTPAEAAPRALRPGPATLTCLLATGRPNPSPAP